MCMQESMEITQLHFLHSSYIRFQRIVFNKWGIDYKDLNLRSTFGLQSFN